MRLKIASVLLLAGTVVGCANNPPPPPPPAPEPAPAPAPAAPPVMAPMSGSYKGTAEVAGDNSRSCHAPRGTQTARVRNNSIMIAGVRGSIGPDGTITGRNVSGTVNGGNADITVKRGRCSYHYTLSNGSTTMNSGSSNGGSSSGATTGE